MRNVNLTFFDINGARHALELEFDLGDWVQNDIWSSLKAGIFYEHETSKFFMHVARPGDVFFDIGANVGYFALLMAELLGEKGRVVAFEPNPRTRAQLIAMSERNKLNIVVEKEAVAEGDGKALFRDNGQGDSNGALALDDVRENSFEVDITSLDSYMAKSGAPIPKVIKIDVEGAELQVFRGAAKLFSQPELEFIICEFNVPQLHRFGTSVDDLRAFMAEKGFGLYMLDNEDRLPKYVPRGVAIRMTSVANMLFAREEALGRYWPDVFNECYLYERQKKQS